MIGNFKVFQKAKSFFEISVKSFTTFHKVIQMLLRSSFSLFRHQSRSRIMHFLQFVNIVFVHIDAGITTGVDVVDVVHDVSGSLDC